MVVVDDSVDAGGEGRDRGVDALERWTDPATGLECIVTDGGSGYNGYVRVPPGSRDAYADGHSSAYAEGVGGSTYGPDRYGWVGLDTGRPGHYWARDDLQRLREIPLVGESLYNAAVYKSEVAEKMNRLFGEEKVPLRRWTLGDLRAKVGELAAEVAAAHATDSNSTGHKTSLTRRAPSTSRTERPRHRSAEWNERWLPPGHDTGPAGRG